MRDTAGVGEVDPDCCGCGGRGWCCARLCGLLDRLCGAVARRKTVEPPAPGLKQRLTCLDLAALGLSGVVGVGGYVYVGVGAAEWAGPSIVLSVVLAAVSALITGAACAELGVRVPRSGGIFTHVYVSLGELPAVLVASTLLLDLVLMAAVGARSSSEYLSAATEGHWLEARLPLLHQSRYLAPQPDLLAAALLLLATVVVVAGTKLVCQAVMTGAGVSLVALTAALSASLLTADASHWTHPPGFMPHGLQGVVRGAAMLSVAMGGGHHAGLLAGECGHYRSLATRLGVGVGVAALLVLFPAAVAATLSSSNLTPTAPLTQLFPGAPLRALAGVGGVLGLGAATAGGLVAGSRLAHRLACDGLAPKCLGKVARCTATPWAAALFCGAAAGVAAAVGSSWALVRAAGAGGAGAGVAGAAAVLARRYRPQAAHHPLESAPCETTPTSAHLAPVVDDTEPYRVSVEWAGGNWASTLFDPPSPPTWASWRTSRFLMATFTVNCLAGVGVVRAAQELDVGMWAWAGVALCACGCVVCGLGLWLQPRHPPPPMSAHNREAAPLLPLLAILTNILLLLHLPPTALAAACGVWAAAAVAWLLHGRTASMEAVLSRALLLTHSGHYGNGESISP